MKVLNVNKNLSYNIVYGTTRLYTFCIIHIFCDIIKLYLWCCIPRNLEIIVFNGQFSLYQRLRKAAKKVLLLMAGPLRPNPPLPPPLELNGRWNFGTLEKKGSKKSYFFLNGPALYAPGPPPLLMARPLREELFFILRLPLQHSKLAYNISLSPTMSLRVEV